MTAQHDGAPSRWEADVVLTDGGTAHLRPIRPSDAEGLQRFHLKQSPESVYLRFFAPMPKLSDRDLERFTVVDNVNRVALVITIGEDIVGIGRFDKINAEVAEIAFNIADAHQGRGIGSVLLEHLAAIARELGVLRFVADVLPQNKRMVAVFHDAGYETTHRYEDGIISVAVDLEPTQRSREVMESREHRAEASSITTLLNPSSVVLIGASRREGTIGHTLLLSMLASGFTGALHIVHTGTDAILGIPTHHSLADVPRPIDVAVVAVPATSVADVVRDCLAAEVRGLVVISGGFAEADAKGRERQEELAKLAHANGMRVIGPNSWGVLNPDPAVRLNVSLREELPPWGGLGMFCQSGALSIAVLNHSVRRGIGLSTFVSAGNRADVSANDCLQYWETDPRTEVVGLYLESTGNPRKFTRIARRVSRAKPVLVLTSGTTGFGIPPGLARRRITQHAPAAAFDAILAQTGCLRVGTLRGLFDAAALLTSQPLPGGSAVAVVANSAALAALVADACVANGMTLIGVPVTVPELAPAEEFADAVTSAAQVTGVHAVLGAFAPALPGQAVEAAAAWKRVATSQPVPVVGCLIGGAGPDADANHGLFESPEEAAVTLGLVMRYARWRRQEHGEPVDPQPRDTRGAQTMVEDILASHPAGLDLDPRRTADLLDRYGIELWPALAVSNPDDAVEAAERLGWPVALKSAHPDLQHRIDLGGVRLDIADADELRRDVIEMAGQLADIGGADLFVQRMAPVGVPCVIRTLEDPQYGPVISFGVSGDATELLGDIAYRVAPLSWPDIDEMVRSVRAAPRFFGWHADRPIDLAALEDLLARVSVLADEISDLAEVELNPVLVSQHGLSVLGARIRLTERDRGDDRRSLTATDTP